MSHLAEVEYKNIFHSSPNPYVLFTPDLIVADINEAHLQLTGARRENVIGKHLFDAFPPPQQEIADLLQSSLDRVKKFKIEDTIHLLRYPIRYSNKDGKGWKDRYWMVKNKPILNQDGCVVFILNNPIEVTHLISSGDIDPSWINNSDFMRNANIVHEISKVENEHRKMRALMEQAPGFVSILRGPDFVFELANKAYYQLIGHRDILGKPVREALPEIEGQGYFELLEQVYRSGEPYIGRAKRIHMQQAPDSDLAELYIDFIYQPIFEDDGSVSGIFVQGHDVTDAHNLSRKLSYQASHDSLTGLFNRREFELRVENAIKEMLVIPNVLSLLFLDLDHFKNINDVCGHRAGDEFLRMISMVLSSRLRATDTLARLGGDEFGLLLKGCPEHVAMNIAQDLRQAVSEVEFVWQNRRFSGSVSIGVFSFNDINITITDALSVADAACFLAKEKGRNRVQVNRKEDDELINRRQEIDWIRDLTEALKDNTIELYCQKIQALEHPAKYPNRYEILIRLRNNDGNIIPPMAFIPAAERYGLMPAIDRYVIEKTFLHIATKFKDHTSLLSISVNLSGASLNDDTFPGFVRNIINVTGIDPKQICFEITETTAVANLAKTSNVIRDLKKLGFRFALDDFGSGMSSFGYLKHLPIDYLKIDGTFIRQIQFNQFDAAIVDAIVRIANAMHIETVAEYVENESMWPLLIKIGVNYGQGYSIHQPTPLQTLKPE